MCFKPSRAEQERESARRQESHPHRRERPTWRNTRPRGNQPTHRPDVERSVERFEALLGR